MLTGFLQQIDDTVGIMRDNINKVSQRGERLDTLQDKTDNLAVSAQGFRRGANRVRKQMWWKVRIDALLSLAVDLKLTCHAGHEDAHVLDCRHHHSHSHHCRAGR